MGPTDELRHEHRVILLVLGAAEREAISIRKTGRVDAPKLRAMLEFFSAFADRCHHAKEERLLFAALKEAGLPEEAEAPFLMEHEQGRRRLRAIAGGIEWAEKGDPDEIAAVGENLAAYVDLLRAHIVKEDDDLLPLAERLLDARQKEGLAREFERLESEEIGEGVHERYHQLAHELGEH